MKQLGISEQNIIYYSDLAQFYTIQKLRTFRSKNQFRLYLFCYINNRLRKINDHLIASFIQKVLVYQKQGDAYQKKQIESLASTDKQLRNQAYKIMLVNVNDKIPDGQVRSKAFEIVPKDEYRKFLSEFKKTNRPRKRVCKNQIISEWDKVLRILVSLALKKTTQANIVRKLSTTKSTSPTLKALIGLDEIIMTDYLLGYIDDKEQRSVVQRSLNRGESYHQLTASIAKVNGGKQLGGKKDIDLTINAESIRLIANIIIHHNATIL